ncbi:MAG: hypothetical protein KZQ66_09120 [Candidatus Thiodiazotropha sp. (ex Lucinoma aequizonata)]|nr:hypothetical protein [Candidatus Thiodiazotropha sp. (ex Lucinoma aequizonata)]MCU7897695.1 hypothetical protein [Candidatus Thiodiazotropha sp. (ex Lucinoma aequizonata)]MCU7902132.1 hypothetical protein [Candidatus Thiodiazotropha sp. (ex Lucinoma aequizonata)]MCU7911257.1 hypothetical protein [Candidatus Thiodiazotropha sp. (ex Lucinoma aequizonata)]
MTQTKNGISALELIRHLCVSYGTAWSIKHKLMHKRVFDLVKDFGTSPSTKIDSIFDSLLCPERPAYVTIPYCTSTASCSCTTPS